MQAVAKVKNVRYGVRKLRRVVDLVRGKSVAEAFAMLSILHTQTKGAPLVENALKSAVANFKQKSGRWYHHEAYPPPFPGPCFPYRKAALSHHSRCGQQGVIKMGQKTHPNGLRLGVIRGWESKWYAEDKFADLLYEDIVLRRYLMKRFEHASLSKVGIERTVKKVNVNLFTARPGIVIGRKGEELEKLKGELQFLTGKEIYINVQEIKRPETDAKLVAENIARQLEKRISFRRAMKRAIQSAMRMGVEGIKVQCGGRLGGAEIARVEKYAEGRVPLHTLRADIDYATAIAKTVYGAIGIKVWIMHGEKIGKDVMNDNKREK